MTNTCLSGGAPGSDTEFGDHAILAGHGVVHFSFEGHKTICDNLVVLSEQELHVADPFLKEANKVIKRRFPMRWTEGNNLLRRNYYQINKTDSVYAISSFDEKGIVRGGTAWAVYMFINRFPKGEPVPAYVFDQERDFWLTWDGGLWRPCKSPATPTGLYTGIGSREINVKGKEAIKHLYNSNRESYKESHEPAPKE